MLLPEALPDASASHNALQSMEFDVGWMFNIQRNDCLAASPAHPGEMMRTPFVIIVFFTSA